MHNIFDDNVSIMESVNMIMGVLNINIISHYRIYFFAGVKIQCGHGYPTCNPIDKGIQLIKMKKTEWNDKDLDYILLLIDAAVFMYRSQHQNNLVRYPSCAYILHKSYGTDTDILYCKAVFFYAAILHEESKEVSYLSNELTPDTHFTLPFLDDKKYYQFKKDNLDHI